MIAKCVPTQCGTRTFATGIAYVQKHTHQQHAQAVGVGVSFADRTAYASDEAKAAWTHTRGVSSVTVAAREMEAVACMSAQCEDPVQHEILAYAKHETPTPEQMVCDVERLLSALDMADHQYVMSVHTDTDDLHAHIIANRVGPDGRANAKWQDRPARERVCAQIAAERGWDIVVGFHNRDLVREQRGVDDLPPAPQRRVFDREFNRAHGRGELSWQDAARPYVLDAVERATSWDDLRARLDTHGVIVKAVERNGRLSGLAFAEGPAAEAPGCAASRIDAACKLSALEARFGSYGGPERAVPDFAQTAVVESRSLWHERMRPVILDAVERATSWRDLERHLSSPWGIVLKGVERGGRFQGLAFAAGTGADAAGCSASRVDARCKLSALEARFGAFPGRTPSHDVQAREPVQDTQRETPARAMPEEAAAHTLEAEAAGTREREGLRARVEREATGSSPVLGRARGIAENARLREEYGRYRDAFFAQQRERGGERRDTAWAEECAQRRVESERRWEVKQLQRGVVRTLTPRGVLRELGYGVVEHSHQRRTERERARAHARWEGVKAAFAQERAEAVRPMRYRDFVAERAQAGDERAERVREYLEGHVGNGPAEPVRRVPERAAAPASGAHSRKNALARVAEEQPQPERSSPPTVEAVRAELKQRSSEEGQRAQAEVWRLSVFTAQYERYKRVDAALVGASDRGVMRIPLSSDAGAPFSERLGQVERGVLRAEAALREVDAGVQGLRDAGAHERSVAALADRPYELLRAELGEMERRVLEGDARLGREHATLWPLADMPLRDAGAEIGQARERVVEDARDKALPYTAQEWERHDEIKQRQASYNPFASIGLERLERSLAEGHTQRVEQAGVDAHRAFEEGGEANRIAERCRIANAEGARAQERLGEIGRERSAVGIALQFVERGRGEVDRLERDDIPAPVLTLDRTAAPEALTQQIVEGIVAARASVGYEQQRTRLDALEGRLLERAAALESERKALGVVAKPESLERQQGDAWERFLEETKCAAAFTVVESQRLAEARMLREHWNPLTRWQAERTERETIDAQAMRERAAVGGARTVFAAREMPEIARRFEEQRDARVVWETRSSALTAAVEGVSRERGEIYAAREDLAAMERAGVPWREMDRALDGRTSAQPVLMRAEIGAVKDTLTREVSAEELRGALKPIVEGSARGFTEEERKAAFGIVQQLKDVGEKARFTVENDMHRVLGQPEPVREQVRDHLHDVQERLRASERSRVRSRSMEMDF